MLNKNDLLYISILQLSKEINPKCIFLPVQQLYNYNYKRIITVQKSFVDHTRAFEFYFKNVLM